LLVYHIWQYVPHGSDLSPRRRNITASFFITTTTLTTRSRAPTSYVWDLQYHPAIVWLNSRHLRRTVRHDLASHIAGPGWYGSPDAAAELLSGTTLLPPERVVSRKHRGRHSLEIDSSFPTAINWKPSDVIRPLLRECGIRLMWLGRIPADQFSRPCNLSPEFRCGNDTDQYQNGAKSLLKLAAC